MYCCCGQLPVRAGLKGILTYHLLGTVGVSEPVELLDNLLDNAFCQWVKEGLELLPAPCKSPPPLGYGI